MRVPSKSTLQRDSEWFSVEEIREIDGYLLNAACQEGGKGKQALNLGKPLEIKDYFLDTSCVKANIHYPVDWKLIQEQAPVDSKLMMESIQRVEKTLGRKIRSAVTDRVFESPSNIVWLQKQNIYNEICPKDPQELKKLIELM